MKDEKNAQPPEHTTSEGSDDLKEQRTEYLRFFVTELIGAMV